MILSVFKWVSADEDEDEDEDGDKDENEDEDKVEDENLLILGQRGLLMLIYANTQSFRHFNATFNRIFVLIFFEAESTLVLILTLSDYPFRVSQKNMPQFWYFT